MLLLTGCADASDDRSSSGADNEAGTSMGSCVLRVIIDGKEWSGWPMKEPLHRPIADTDVRGFLPGCDDVGGDDQGAEPDEQVILKPIEGIAPEEVLFLPDYDLDDQIFVPGMDVSFDSLSPGVQNLIEKG